MKRSIRSKNKKLSKVAESILSLADSSFNDEILSKSSGKKVNLCYVTRFLLAKSTKTFRAILILSKYGYKEDAQILVRSILENLINLEYMAKEDSENKALLFVDFGLIEQQNVSIDHLKNEDDEDEEKKLRELVNSRKDGYNKAVRFREKQLEILKKKKKNVKKKSWSGLTIKDMAEETNLHDTYYKKVYWMISNLSHPAIMVDRDYCEIDKNNNLITYDRPQLFHESKFIFDGLIFGVDVYIKSLRFVDRVFNLKNNSKINQIEQEVMGIGIV